MVNKMRIRCYNRGVGVDSTGSRLIAERSDMTPHESDYRTIQITQGQKVIIDAELYEKYNSFKWHARWNNHTQSFYAMRHTSRVNGKQKTVYMHRDIRGIPPCDSRTVDHAFHNTLDNRRNIGGKINLRIATKEEQAHNKGKYRNNTSGYKGVCLQKTSGKWLANIRVNGKCIYLGIFLTREAAYAAYCEAARLYHGEFACLV